MTQSHAKTTLKSKEGKQRREQQSWHDPRALPGERQTVPRGELHMIKEARRNHTKAPALIFSDASRHESDDGGAKGPGAQMSQKNGCAQKVKPTQTR